MNYRINPKNGDRLSILGFGCMRFPRSFDDTEKLVRRAIEGGVNYFDTAYVYPGNEATLGRALRGYRDRVKLATKMPPYLVKTREDFDKIFNTQLERLQTDHIDYYLLHMLTDTNVWERLLGLGALEWIAEKKASGQIVNLGFSYHGGRDDFVQIVDAYDWDFCMIQYNFLDENNQAGKSGLEYASQKGLPVMIMEPLRGGKLVTALPREVYGVWDSAPVRRAPADWGLRWVWNHPQVNVVLSGMSSQKMLEENLAAASDAEANAFTADDLALFDRVRAILSEKIKVPCTGCNYCMPCPAGVDIPTCFACYNNKLVEGRIMAFLKYLMQTSMKRAPSNASLCVKCGKCETHCPQKIAIRQELQNVARAFEKFYYRPVRFLTSKFMKL